MALLESPKARRIAYGVAALLFVVTGAVGLANLPDERGADPAPVLFVVVLLLLAPLTSACNAAEYLVTARFVGVRVQPVAALEVAVLSTAANLAPLPGAALVRGAALRRAGIPL